MPENIRGTNAQNILSLTKTAEGSFTVTHGPFDIVANTAGHVLAIPTVHLGLWTFKSAFRNPPKELAQQLADRYKDVPWKGDVLVRVGHTSVIGELQRYFSSHEIIRGRPIFGIGKIKNVTDFAARILLLPSLLFMLAKSKLFRQDNYNPLTNTVTVFHPRLGVGMHEMGHAEFFNQMPRGKREAYAIAKIASGIVEKFPIFGSIPFITSFLEYKASALAIHKFKDDPERLRELKVMEPAFATYLMADLMILSFPFVGANPLTLAMAAETGLKLTGAHELIKKLLEFGWTHGIWAGTVAGNILSRAPYPGRRQRFGYVFEGKKSAAHIKMEKSAAVHVPPVGDKPTERIEPKMSKMPELSAHQILVATAKPVGPKLVPEQRLFHTTQHENGKQKKHSNFNRVTF